MSYLDDLFSLDGKVAVTIGAGGVLGGAMASALGRAGARVAVLDLVADAAETQAEAIADVADVATMGIEVDATSDEGLREACDRVVSDWGRVDILLNAPGINSGTPVFEITREEWDKILEVNLTSYFLASKIFGRRMVEQGEGGSVINISSASSGPPLSKVFTYSITKAGINNMTQFLAREWAPHRVRVNAIAPGFFPAEQNRKLLTEERVADIMRHTPMGRFGGAGELSGAVVWLASEAASSFVTGTLVRVDGGFTAMTI
jgi:NAD(P)-dependent dehydrogenase (short-subunit alcohol dehydrogenase family)